MAVRYQGKQHPFSHFYPTNVTINGKTFQSAEQAYQYVKTACVHAFVTSVQVVAAGSDSQLIKQLAKNANIKETDEINFPQSKWDVVKRNIMFRIDYEKYSQSPALLQQLLSTGSKELIENVPFDSFWGIGKNGTGQNQAGRILMELREIFKRGGPVFPSALIYGDSLVKDTRVHNAHLTCIRGADSEFVSTAASAATGKAVRILVMIAGTNDLVRRDDKLGPTNLIAKKIADWASIQANNNPGQVVIISTLFPRTNGPPELATKLIKYRTDLIARRDKNNNQRVRIFDAGQILNSTHLGADGIHLNATGSRVLSQVFTTMIQAILSNRQPPYLI